MSRDSSGDLRVRPVSVLLAGGITRLVLPDSSPLLLRLVSHVRRLLCRPPQPTHCPDTRLPPPPLSLAPSTGPRVSPRRTQRASRVPPFSVSPRLIFRSLSNATRSLMHRASVPAHFPAGACCHARHRQLRIARDPPEAPT